MSEQWDEETDVVVVGFGGAGACAAIEAREAGARVLVLDRFEGGGATAISGGVVYAGGGTAIQLEAGVQDTVEDMRAYLAQEVGDVVSPETLAEFCEGSVARMDWLAARGVPFEASLCPVKTSYPNDKYFLYFSGNEGFAPFRDNARPAPRGHRAKGRSLPGKNFYEPLKQAALGVGVEVWNHTTATRLIQDEAGRVVGVEVRRIEAPGKAAWHGRLERWAIKLVNYVPKLAKNLRRRAAAMERSHGMVRRIRATRGVVLATGGFIYNRKMVQEHAPAYRRAMPLGTSGCGGLGHELGAAVGGELAHMQRVSAWRFLNPPEAFIRGVLVNAEGRRYVNESLYGAAVGEAMVEDNGGVGWLLIDGALKAKARSQVGKGQTQWFQTAPTLLNLWFNCKKAGTLEELAAITKAPAEALGETIATYNAAVEAEEPDAFGKEYRATLTPPYFAVDAGIRSKLWPLPTLTLGGLAVEEATGMVRRGDGSVIDGLYAAGRVAVGVCTRQYVSGLSIADCVFSGRRAGRAVATATKEA